MQYHVRSFTLSTIGRKSEIKLYDRPFLIQKYQSLSTEHRRQTLPAIQRTIRENEILERELPIYSKYCTTPVLDLLSLSF